MKSSAIVSSLFPKNVRDRLMANEIGSSANGISSQKHRLKTFMSDTATEPTASIEVYGGSRPIADLFPEATVMFADLANFTAWSSTREPSQVFVLLESVYGCFDKLAAKRGVFKVETIGDCYVAVAGLPDPRVDLAVAMLSVTLGPETEDMAVRIGFNSGPVTAGVLRGQKSRFQLFGDTVNTASCMENTGKNNRIHVSQSTADELVKHRKGRWLRSREDAVEVKGKGTMATYWVFPSENAGSATEQDATVTLTNSFDNPKHSSTANPGKFDAKFDRLIDWNVDVLAQLLQSVVSTRTIIENGEVPIRRYN
eukprot:Nitzschia sp. Nitz4//scaffold32_size149145//101839//102804//NITZ4_002892-RA/size149145-snap-gene-0.21-mRNA-1//-1//CDS//3329548108//8130//frame0